VKIPKDALIPDAKLTNYLLVFREQDDKSKFLAQAGFTLDNPEILNAELRRLIAEIEVEEDEENDYGIFYVVAGDLIGPNERTLSVITIWMQEKTSGHYHFITLKPWRKG
jgi:hypothetical protein